MCVFLLVFLELLGCLGFGLLGLVVYHAHVGGARCILIRTLLYPADALPESTNLQCLAMVQCHDGMFACVFA